jgi:hypothetical protein
MRSDSTEKRNPSVFEDAFMQFFKDDAATLSRERVSCGKYDANRWFSMCL